MQTTLTFIGNGNMALSMAQGLKEKYTIEVVGRDMTKLDAFEEALGCTIKKAFLNNFDISGKTLLLCITSLKSASSLEARQKYSIPSLQEQALKHFQTTSRQKLWCVLCQTLPQRYRGL